MDLNSIDDSNDDHYAHGNLNTPHELLETPSPAPFFKIFDKINNQNGLSYANNEDNLLREFNEDFTMTRVEAGPFCCRESCFYLAEKIPTRFLAFSFMVIVGILVGCLSVSADILVFYLQGIDTKLSTYLDNMFANFSLHFLYSFVLLLTATILTQFIGPNAKGSGIPEMKCILSGVWLHKYLAFEVLFAKFIGVILVNGSGAILGKEGPFVHISSIVEDQLSKRIGLLKKLRMNPAMMQQMLAAACSLGVAANFGVPYGGLLFSLEVTSTYYPITNYYFSFIAVLSGSYTFLAIWNTFRGNSIVTPYYYATRSCLPSLSLLIIAYSIIVGIVCGIIGAVIVVAYKLIMKLMMKYPNFILFKPLIYTSLIVIFTSILTFPGFVGPIASLHLGKATRIFFDCETNFANTTEWPQHHSLPWQGSVGLFLISRILLQIATMAMQVPLGVMGPGMALGAATGYIIGHVFQMFSLNFGIYSLPTVFSMVGASAMIASVTHTLSSAILILEITGNFEILFPSMIGTVVAIVVSNLVTDDLFSVVMDLRKLPYLPSMIIRSAVIKASQIMDTKYPVLSTLSTYSDLEQVCINLSSEKNRFENCLNVEVAFVDDKKRFLGSIPYSAIALQLQKEKSEYVSGKLMKMMIKYNSKNMPFTFSKNATLEQIHSCFVTMRLSTAFVLEQGLVIGTITRSRVMEFAGNRNYEELLPANSEIEERTGEEWRLPEESPLLNNRTSGGSFKTLVLEK